MPVNGITNRRIRSTELLHLAAAVLFFMFALLKPYYLKSSGSIGAADLCLAASGAVLMLRECCLIAVRLRQAHQLRQEKASLEEGRHDDYASPAEVSETDAADSTANRTIANSAPYRKSACRNYVHAAAEHFLFRQDIAWYIFLIFVIAINGYYSHAMHSGEYLKYTMFWLFNGLAVWTWRKLHVESSCEAYDEAGCSCTEPDAVYENAACGSNLRRCSNGSNALRRAYNYVFCDGFDRIFCAVLACDIIVQLAVMISGHGRLFVEPWGALRYMGTFNDPNQLAFFIFMSLMLIYKINVRRTQDERKITLSRISAHRRQYIVISLLFITGLLIISQTKSTGIMLGMAIFFVLLWCCSLRKLTDMGRISGKTVITLVLICVICFCILLAIIWPPADFNVQNVEYNMITRIQEKIWKLANGGIGGFLYDRGAGKLAMFPQYMLYGAGEGGFARFIAAATNGMPNEIHCGLFSILFCYGIIPTGLMCIWTINSLRKQSIWELCAALAILAESMTLINYRQPMFWFLLL